MFDAKDHAKSISAEETHSSLAEQLFGVEVGSPAEALFGVPVAEFATV